LNLEKLGNAGACAAGNGYADGGFLQKKRCRVAYRLGKLSLAVKNPVPVAFTATPVFPGRQVTRLPLAEGDYD